MRPTAKSDDCSEKKKLQLKYLRDFVTTSTASVDGGKFGVELSCPHRPLYRCNPLFILSAPCVQSTCPQIAFTLVDRAKISSADHTAICATVECDFHLPVRVDRRSHMRLVDLSNGVLFY